MKHLKELGLDIDDASFVWDRQYDTFNQKWTYYKIEKFFDYREDQYEDEVRVPAYTLSDMLCHFNDYSIIKRNNAPDKVCFSCVFDNNHHQMSYGDTEMEAVYKMLVWALENKLIGKYKDLPNNIE